MLMSRRLRALCSSPTATSLRGSFRGRCCRRLVVLAALTALGAMVNMWHQSKGEAQITPKVPSLALDGKNPDNDDLSNGHGGGGGGGGGLRVAVCFFGLTRSLRWTLPSVKQRVLDVLRDQGVQVDVFVHTYDLLEVNNQRAGEKEIEYADYAQDYRALHPTRSLVTDQDDFDMAWPEPLSMTRYKWIYTPDEIEGVIRNVFRAYWSMSIAWGLMAAYSLEKRVSYDAVVLARPDVWFHVDIDLPRRTFPLPQRTLFLPSFDANDDQRGRKNDRFGYGSVTAMRVLMNRMATLMDPDAGRFSRRDLDSEWILGHHLMKNNISVHGLDFPVTRVRLNGGIPFFDHARVRAACSLGTDPVACEMVRLDYKFPQ